MRLFLAALIGQKGEFGLLAPKPLDGDAREHALALLPPAAALFFRWPGREVLSISVSQYGQRHMMTLAARAFFLFPALAVRRLGGGGGAGDGLVMRTAA